MNTPQVITILGWILRDTFQQAKATRIFWTMLVFSAVCILFCLGVSVEGGLDIRDPQDGVIDPRTDQPAVGPVADYGWLHLFFGAFKVPLARDRVSAVHLLH
ncbi:MAG: hypothetical protein NZM29_02215, partial [Nitrospira sp.]|nr:hypothetical protein [Nitrospira sp.]